MASHSEQLNNNHSYNAIDYAWFATRFESLLERITLLENAISTIEHNLQSPVVSSGPAIGREYYSVPEFAALVGRGEYTVREWCRLERINAKKCETGRGDAKSWKIPADELNRYRDHGLLPTRYLR